MSGDGLSIFLFWAGCAVSALLGAIASPPGWRAKVLWVLSAFFVILVLYWLFGRSWLPAIATVLTALFRSGALLMVGTVAIVALMIGDRSPPTPLAALSKAVPPTQIPMGRATLREVGEYIRDRSHWGGERERSAKEIFLEIKDAAYRGSIIGFGRFDDADRALSEIHHDYWAEMHPSRAPGEGGANALVSDNYDFYDVRFNWNEVQAAWPPKAP